MIYNGQFIQKTLELLLRLTDSRVPRPQEIKVGKSGKTVELVCCYAATDLGRCRAGWLLRLRWPACCVPASPAPVPGTAASLWRPPGGPVRWPHCRHAGLAATGLLLLTKSRHQPPHFHRIINVLRNLKAALKPGQQSGLNKQGLLA